MVIPYLLPPNTHAGRFGFRSTTVCADYGWQSSDIIRGSLKSFHPPQNHFLKRKKKTHQCRNWKFVKGAKPGDQQWPLPTLRQAGNWVLYILTQPNPLRKPFQTEGYTCFYQYRIPYSSLPHTHPRLLYVGGHRQQCFM